MIKIVNINELIEELSQKNNAIKTKDLIDYLIAFQLENIENCNSNKTSLEAMDSIIQLVELRDKS